MVVRPSWIKWCLLWKKLNCLYLLDISHLILILNNIGLTWLPLIERNHGTFCIVSHDRDLLLLICNKIWAIEKGSLLNMKSNYDQYQDQLLIRQQEYQVNLKKYHQETKRLKQPFKPSMRSKNAKVRSLESFSPSGISNAGMKTNWQ